jgi:dihydrofolate synthase / folylpolyglutamate synthase
VPAPSDHSLGEALAWLDRHINLEAIERGAAGRAAEPTLERIAALCRAMGDPQRDYPVVHVTGTNGKGSTTRIISSLLIAQGLHVGTVTSPHLEAMNERICTDLRPIGDDDLLAELDSLRELEHFLAERRLTELPPTWFELVSALAFRHFSDAAIDAAVVEVGMGGRWDATNVADALVAVVTNIDLDHVEILGPTRAHIAREKAGIVKSGSTVVVGDEDPEMLAIFEAEAAAKGAGPIWWRGRDFDCKASALAVGGRVVDISTPGRDYRQLFLPLHGAHQGENAAVALCAAEAFFGAPLAEEVVAEAFATSSVPGRLEVLGRRPLVVIDGAHNPAGARVLARALEEDFAAPARIHLVMGCLRGRDAKELISLLPLPRIAEVYACEPASPRAQGAHLVAAAAEELGCSAKVIGEVELAIDAALHAAGEDDLVLVTGSLYVVGAARSHLRRLGSKAP